MPCWVIILPMIDPIGKKQQDEVIERSHYFVDAAAVIFEQKFAYPEIHFDLKGASAGMFKLQGRRHWLRFNPWIFAKYFEDSLATTVPHEVAHYIVHEVFGRRGIRPHGHEWKLLMDAFGADASVTGDYDMSGIPRQQQRRFPYHCGCRSHEISTRRHNLMVKGNSRYLCRYCKAELQFSGGGPLESP